MKTNEATMKLIEVEGVTIEVTTAFHVGAELTVVAAHPADEFGDDTVGLLRASARANIVCMNPRGIGASSAGTQSLEEMARDIECVRRQLNLDPFVFWGMSGGGWLALTYARMYPHRLAGLILDSVCPCFKARVVGRQSKAQNTGCDPANCATVGSGWLVA